jgi:hypothetical protein
MATTSNPPASTTYERMNRPRFAGCEPFLQALHFAQAIRDE